MSSEVSTDSGLSLQLPNGMQRVPELESDRLWLVARAEPWEAAELFRPNLNVEVMEPAPECCTIQQLSHVTIASQLALGVHVLACEPWVTGDQDARRITSIYPAMGAMIVEHQYLAIRRNRPLVLSMQYAGADHEWGMVGFYEAVTSLRCDWHDPPAPVDPDPASMPVLDEFALALGERLERLSHIRGLQPYRTFGESKRPRRLGAYRRRLVAADVAIDGQRRHAALKIEITGETAVVEAGPSPASEGGEQTVDVIPAQTVPVALARWLGAAPAWVFKLGEQGMSRRVVASDFDARLADSGAPPPADASAPLAHMWSQRWEFATIQSSRSVLTIVTTPESGAFTVLRDGGEVELTPIAGLAYLPLLVRISGFEM